MEKPNERGTLIGLEPGASDNGAATVRLTVAWTAPTAKALTSSFARLPTPRSWVSRLRVPMDLSESISPPKELWSGPGVGTLTAGRQGPG